MKAPFTIWENIFISQFVSQSLAIETYFRVQSKVQKDKEKSNESSGLRPEIGLPEYIRYMNALGAFFKPGRVVQQTETP